MNELEQAYRAIVPVPGLEAQRAERLVQHAMRTNAHAPEQAALDPLVLRIAATLLAANEDLSSPTAVAEALNAARVPGFGEALLKLFDGMLFLRSAALQTELAHDGLLRRAAGSLIEHLRREIVDFQRRHADEFSTPATQMKMSPGGKAR